MSLPKLTLPTYQLKLPGLKKVIKYRPYVTREEKMLLIAMQSEDSKQIVEAAKELLRSCILSPGVDVEKLSPFDIDFLFINIRAKSVGEIADIQFHHSTCKKNPETGCMHRVKINLTDVKVKFPENHDKKIPINENIGIEMRYPSPELINKFSNPEEKISEIEMNMKIAAACIDIIWEKDKVYNASQYSEDEIMEFLESLPRSALTKIIEFFETMPHLEHTEEFVCKECGDTVKFSASGLADFFAFASAETV